MTKSDETAKMAEALDRAAQALGKHSGPSSSSGERDAFARDLHTAALRYARAYYAEARDLGLIPEYEATTTIYDHVASSFGVTRDEAAACCRRVLNDFQAEQHAARQLAAQDRLRWPLQRGFPIQNPTP